MKQNFILSLTKRRLLSLALIMSSLISWGTTHTQTVTFSLDDFSNEVIDGETRITYTAGNDAPVGHNRAPYLPWIYKEFDIPVNSAVSDIRIEAVTKPVTYLAGVKLYPRFMPIPTSSLDSFDAEAVRKNVEKGVYPSVQAQGVGTRVTQGQGKARFLFCPFRTSADQDTVYFIERIKVTYSCETAKGPAAVQMAVSDASIATADSKLKEKIAYSKKLDNVIITVDSLKSAFLPLRDWKRKKGMHCELLTVEEISGIYSEETTVPHQIKRALHCLYRNYSLESVTIGGDGRIVPTFLGYSPVRNDYFDNPRDTLKSRYVPTDHFYLCFDGDFYWNANGNGIAGELEDNVSFEPYLSIGRLPIYNFETSNHVVSNLLSYEQIGDLHNNFNNMLAITDTIGGERFLVNGHYFNDSYVVAQEMYKRYILPYNDQLNFKIFNDLSSNGDINGNYSIEGLKQELAYGPSFINISAHGLSHCIIIKDKQFSRTEINNQLLPARSIILANSCHTGNFSRYVNNNSTIPAKYIVAGYSDVPTCFGSACLFQEGARGIAYIGNTREGWGSPKGQIGDTDLWHALIWESIFDENDNRTIGESLRDIKYDYRLNDFEYFPGRRMLMSENLMGDPDIKAYTTNPNRFDALKIYPGIGYWNINLGGITGYQVYIGYLHNGVYEYEPFPVATPNKYTFKKNHFSIVIQKNNFVPYFSQFDTRCVGDFNSLYLQNVDIMEDIFIEAPQIRIGQQVTDIKRTGEVLFLQGHSSIKGECVTLEPGTEIHVGASVSIN